MSKRLKDLTPVTSPADADALVLVTDTDTNLITVANLRTAVVAPATESTLGGIKVGNNLEITEDGVLSAMQSTLPTQTGNSGKFLTTNGTTVSWGAVNFPSGLPNQSGKSGKWLKTNGVTASWEPIAEREALPPKTGNSGKFLTTNGTTLSWSRVDAFPSQTGNFGRLLTTDGSSTTLWTNIISIVPTGVGNSTAVALTRDLRLADYTTTTRDTYLTAEPDGALIWNSSFGELQVRKSSKWRGIVTKSYSTSSQATDLANWGVAASEVQELGNHTFRAWGQNVSYLWRSDVAVNYWFRFVPSLISTVKLNLTIDILSDAGSGSFSGTPYNVYSGTITILCQKTGAGTYIVKCSGTLIEARGENRINMTYSNNSLSAVDGSYIDIPMTTTYNNDNFTQDPNAGCAVYKWDGFFTKRTHGSFIIGTVAV
jgi:hypothetical protein